MQNLSIKMKTVFLISLICLKVLQAGEPFTPQMEFFSEGSYWSGTSDISNTVLARAFARVGGTVQPFLQMGSEQFFGVSNRSDLYVSPGLHWNLKYLRVFGEHRFHQSNWAESHENEWRLLLVSGSIVERPLSDKSRVYAFWEPYSEFLLSSDARRGASFQGLSRVGFKYQISGQTSTDLFVEPFIAFFRNQFGAMEQYQLKPSLRARTCLDSICMALSAARIVSLNEETDPGFRFLATVGGFL